MSLRPEMQNGRAFIAPKDRTGGRVEVWLNFPPTKQNYHMYPPYLQILEPSISEESYNKMIRSVDELYKTEYPSMAFAWLLLCLAPCTLCLSMLYLYLKITGFRSKMSKIVSELGNSKVRFEATDTAHPTARTLHSLAYDHNGMILEHVVGKHGVMQPVWPPVGNNIVVTLPHDVPWPPGALSAAPAQQVIGRQVM